jgi:hypothetical protein
MKMTAALQVTDGEPPGGAMAGKHDTSCSGIVQQMESTGRKYRTWRAHLELNQSRG